jgi:GntR family transcriptional regulator
MALTIILSNTAGTPIYDQIKQQIKAAIMGGDLREGEPLPSIRALARDLQVSVITTTRAYSDLAAEGFVANVPGKGSYVLPRDSGLVREALLREIEDHLGQAARRASMLGLSDADLHATLDTVLHNPLEEP